LSEGGGVIEYLLNPFNDDRWIKMERNQTLELNTGGRTDCQSVLFGGGLRLLTALLVVAFATHSHGGDPPARKVDFLGDVQPILA
jgi:hypothetical protein